MSNRRIGIFIDAAYLAYVLKMEHNQKKIDLSKFAKKMADLSGNPDVLRAYYYDSLPYLSQNPSPDEQDRFNRKTGYIEAIKRIPRMEVRLGVCEFRPTSENGFKQKQVDMMLGVDLVKLAIKGKIDDAALFIGDSDFLPAIEVVKNEGVSVHLFHGLNAHKSVIARCDTSRYLSEEFIDSVPFQEN